MRMPASAGTRTRRRAIIWKERTCSPSAFLALRERAIRSDSVYVVGSVLNAATIAARRMRQGTQNPQCLMDSPRHRAFVTEEHEIVSATCRFSSALFAQPDNISPFVLKR